MGGLTFGTNPVNSVSPYYNMAGGLVANYASTVGADPANQGLFSNYNYSTDGVGLDAPIGAFSGAANYALSSGYGGDLGFSGMPFAGMGFGLGGNPIQQAQMWGQYSNTMMDIQIDNSVHRAERERYADLKINGQQSVIQHQTELINNLISEGRYDQVYEQYNILLEEVRKFLPPGATEENVRTMALKACPIVSMLSSNNPFLENVTKGLGFGVGALFTSGKDSRDVRAQITGVPTSFRDKITKYAGWATGALLTLGAVALFRKGGKINPSKWFKAAPKAAPTVT